MQKHRGMLEIERKFLVKSQAFKAESFSRKKIEQGFLNRHPERTVRVRVKGDKGYLTIKGISTDGGVSRFEWEKEIALKEAETLLKICEPGKIKKTRFLIQSEKHTFEVDEFYDENEGLTIAEIELMSVEEEFKKPDWLGKEVTGEERYYNSQLSINPFMNWKNNK